MRPLSREVSADADGPELFRVLLHKPAVVFGPLMAGGIVGNEINGVLTHDVTFDVYLPLQFPFLLRCRTGTTNGLPLQPWDFPACFTV